MAVEILLVAAVDAEIMVDSVVGGAVVVVEAAAVRRVVRDNEVVVDVVEGRCRGGLACSDIGHVGEPVPAVERSVITRLPARVEEQVVPEGWG